MTSSWYILRMALYIFYNRSLFGCWQCCTISWSIGALVHCSIGPLLHWSNGPLVHWSISPLVHWSIGPLVHWSIGPLVHWSTVHWLNVKCKMSIRLNFCWSAPPEFLPVIFYMVMGLGRTPIGKPVQCELAFAITNNSSSSRMSQFQDKIKMCLLF